MVSIETIREQFDELGIEPSDEVVNKCIEICVNNDIIDPVEFVEQWMAYSVSKLSGAEPTVAYLNEMEAHEYTNKSRKVAKLTSIVGGSKGVSPHVDKKLSKITTYRNVDSVEHDVLEMYGCITPKTNKTKSRFRDQNVTTSDGIRGGGSPFTTVTYSPLSTSSKKANPDAPSKAGQIVYTFGSAKLLKQFNWLPSTTATEDGIPTDDQTPQVDRRNRSTDGRRTGISFGLVSSQFANEGSKYMFDSSYDRVIILGDRIYECGSAICNRLMLDTKKSEKSDDAKVNADANASTSDNIDPMKPMDDSEMMTEEEDKSSNWFDGIKVHHVDYPSSEPIRILGRIVVDESTIASSQNAAPGRNQRKLAIVDFDEHTLRYTRLDLSKVKLPAWWSLFPGQTVLLEGINPRGTLFSVSQIFSDRTLTPPRVPSGLEKTLTLVIASAPFTDQDDLLYEKLSSLLLYCNNNPPDVLILTGPFADANCKLYADVAETFDEYFEKIIGTIMSSIGGQTEVFVVANHNDVVSSFVYPTPPYKVRSFYKNLHFLPDPCVFSIEGLEIAVTTVDVVKHLVDNECTVDTAGMGVPGSIAVGGDKIKRSFNHLFNQASFYPLNPPPEDLPLDVDMLNEFGRLNRVPNVMICPSALNRYVREINGCVCINPGFVDGHAADGSYARVIIHPPEPISAEGHQQQQEGNGGATAHTSPGSYIACQIIKT